MKITECYVGQPVHWLFPNDWGYITSVGPGDRIRVYHASWQIPEERDWGCEGWTHAKNRPDRTAAEKPQLPRQPTTNVEFKPEAALYAFFKQPLTPNTCAKCAAPLNRDGKCAGGYHE